MIQILKGIIFGKSGQNPAKETDLPQPTPRILTTNPNQEPNHQREILRREAQISKRTRH